MTKTHIMEDKSTHTSSTESYEDPNNVLLKVQQEIIRLREKELAKLDVRPPKQTRDQNLDTRKRRAKKKKKTQRIEKDKPKFTAW